MSDKRVQVKKKTSELKCGDIVIWPWEGLNNRDEVVSVELPAKGDGEVAKLNFTNPRNWIWSGIDADHLVLEKQS